MKTVYFVKCPTPWNYKISQTQFPTMTTTQIHGNVESIFIMKKVKSQKFWISVLQLVESVCAQCLPSIEENKIALEKALKKEQYRHYIELLYGTGSAQYTDPEKRKFILEARKRDHISHFILRLAYGQNAELSAWFSRNELELFKWRFHSLNTKGTTDLMMIYDFDYKPVRIIRYNSHIWRFHFHVFLRFRWKKKRSFSINWEALPTKTSTLITSTYTKFRLRMFWTWFRKRKFSSKKALRFFHKLNWSRSLQHFLKIIWLKRCWSVLCSCIEIMPWDAKFL